MRWKISRLLLVLYDGSSKGTGNLQKTFQTESRTQVGDRAGSLFGLLEPTFCFYLGRLDRSKTVSRLEEIWRAV